MKDYTAIVLQGIADPANRKNIEAFYISECKKTERDEFISPKLFFDSCIAKIEIFKEYFESKKFEELHEMNEVLVALRQGRFKHKDEDLKNKTIEQCDHEEEQIILNRINDVRKNFIHQIQYPASIFHHDFNGHLSYADVLEMEAAIIAAKLKAGINPATSSTTTEKQKPEFNINQIALKYAYEGMQITRENGNDIAKQYGYNSGEKLFQRFIFYSNRTNRKAIPETKRKLENKIKLIESVIDLLPKNKQQSAKDEVEIIKTVFNKEYQ